MTDAITQQMMTLAALAGTGAKQRPSGETRDQHWDRIKSGITAQLSNTGLTAKGWSLVDWCGLTDDHEHANLAYFAKGPSDSYALVLRGTVEGISRNLSQDEDVGGQMPSFTEGGGPGTISKGAMDAFTNIVSTGPATKLMSLKPKILYVVGHSLGGAMATTLALYLRKKDPTLKILPYTFAAPTAGDGSFATWFNKQFKEAVCVYNKYDVISHGYDSLKQLVDNSTDPFYPVPPGPIAKSGDNGLGDAILKKAALAGSNIYVQPGERRQVLNNPIQYYKDTQNFRDQIIYQHSNDLYLQLLGVEKGIPNHVPVIYGTDREKGSPGDEVKIVAPKGSPFIPNSLVDFGDVAAKPPTMSSDRFTLTVNVPAPGRNKIVEIKVTDAFGTSKGHPFIYTT